MKKTNIGGADTTKENAHTVDSLLAENAELRSQLIAVESRKEAIEKEWNFSLKREQALKNGAPVCGICEMCESNAIARADEATAKLAEEIKKNAEAAETIDSLRLQQEMDLLHLKKADSALEELRGLLGFGPLVPYSDLVVAVAGLLGKCRQLAADLGKLQEAS